MSEKKEQANDGSTAALTSIAETYYRGMLGMPVDYATAYRYYRKAADMGNPSAMNMVAKCYEYGHGIEKDSLKALDWYESASEKGNVAATIRLGDYYRYGLAHIMQKDPLKASEYYRKAFLLARNCGDVWDAPDIYLRIADCLFNGIGFEKDIQNAHAYYSLAFEGYARRIDAGDQGIEDRMDLAEEGRDKCSALLGISEKGESDLPQA